MPSRRQTPFFRVGRDNPDPIGSLVHLPVLLRGERHARAVGALTFVAVTVGGSGKPGDLFVNLLDMSSEWRTSDEGEYLSEARDRETGEPK